jgi:hypothetical protein
VIGLQPDAILSVSTPVTAALQRETRTIPIVFLLVADPVGDGFIVSVPRPGGNITGFILREPSIGSKWPELLAEIAPGVKRGDAASRDCPAVKPLAPTSLTRADRESQTREAHSVNPLARSSEAPRQQEADL